MFAGNKCLKDKCSLQVREGVKPHQTPLRCVANAVQQPLVSKEERLLVLQIIMPLGVGEKPNSTRAL